MSNHTPSSRLRWGAVSLLAIVLAGLVICASWAASQLVETNGAFALAASGGRVAFSVGDEVLLTDDDGGLLAVLPWRFGEVGSVSFDDTGRLYVTDLERREIVSFDHDGQSATRVPLAEPPEFSFEFLVDGNQRFVADTMGHHLQTIRANGTVDRSRRVVYPNGLTRTTLAGVPALVFAETGAREARAWSLDLEPLPWPAAAKLNADLKRRYPRELLELTVTPQGALLATDCKTTAGDCSILRVDTELERVADVGPFGEPDPEAAEGLLGVGELAATSRGSVLVASPRLGAVLEFSSEDGGPPPAGFCEACDAAEYGDPRDVRELPMHWNNGARIRRFGDAQVQRKVEAIWAARHTFNALEHNARLGTWVVASALLLALFLARQARGTGTEAPPPREALQPQVLVALLPIALAFGVGLATGQLWSGLASGAALGVALGVLTARVFVPRLLVQRQTSESGRHAAERYLRARIDSPVQWARFVRPERSMVKEALASAQASQFDDFLDAIEGLAPRLTLLIKTERGLWSVPTSVLGAPQGPLLEFDSLDAPSAAEGVGRLTMRTPRGTWTWSLGRGGGEASATAEHVTPRCERCGQRVGACEHTEVELAVPVLASLVFPGLGALLQGNLAQARVTMVVALGFLLEVVRIGLPQHLGTLPTQPSLWLQPLGAYVMTALGAAFSMVVAWRQARRRIALAEVKGTT